MARKVLTVRDLESAAAGGEVVVPLDTIVTPLAQDEARARGITIRFQESQAAAEGLPAGLARIIAIGADHGGFDLKEELKSYLVAWGYQVLDQGTTSRDAVDYPDFAEAVADAVVRGDASRGIVIDSAGIGSSIAANKVPGARAALCYDRATARNSREHNDANILSLGARLIAADVAREILAAWLETPFAGGRHEKRVDKIRAIEKRHLKS
ncbi:MAG TPA: ribose 5-phosphate isomerase B [Candidatus Acidoferrum sp.]|nr:ribose 5-phosphate isomerase B [Candidatus Acidoferrum sp.]